MRKPSFILLCSLSFLTCPLFSQLEEINVETGSFEAAGVASLENKIVHVSPGCQLNFHNTSTETLSSLQLEGSGSLNKQGPGTLMLTDSSSIFSGSITIQEGVLQAGEPHAFPATSPVVIQAGGVLDLSTFNNTLPTVQLQAGGTLKGSGTLTIPAHISFLGNGSHVVNTPLSGKGVLLQNARGTTTLTAQNSFSGGIRIQQGSVEVTTVSALGTGNISFRGDQTQLIFNTDADETFSRSLSTSNPAFFITLTKRGAGALTFEGNNNFKGHVELALGSLIVGSQAALPSHLSIGIQEGGLLNLNDYPTSFTLLSGKGNIFLGVNEATTLTLNNPIPSSFEGNIAGAGQLVIENSALLSLGGTNSYTGATTVVAGTVALLSPTALPSYTTLALINETSSLYLQGHNAQVQNLSGAGNLYPEGGMVTVLNTVDSIFGGKISGRGSLVKTGLASLTLEGLNDYTGKTHLEAGSLILGKAGVLPPTAHLVLESNSTLSLNDFPLVIGNLEGEGALSLGEGRLTLGDSDTMTFSGTIHGTGEIFKQGTGTFILQGTNTSSGLTHIQEGVFVLNGSVEGPLFIASNATLKGTGQASQKVTVQGYLTPETLKVKGDLELAATSQTVIHIHPSGSSSTLAVEGNLLIEEGAHVHFSAEPGTYTAGLKFPFLTFSHNASAQQLQASFPQIGLNTELMYEESALSLLIKAPLVLQDPFVAISTPPLTLLPTGQLRGNQLHVANYLNTLGTDVLGSPFTTLLSLPVDQLKKALDTLSPSRNTFATFVLENNLFSFNQILEERWIEGRMHRQKEQPQQKLSAHADHFLCRADDFLPPSPKQENSLSLWVAGFGNWMNEHAEDQNPSFHNTSGGALLGVDYTVTNNLLLGGALAYASSSLKENNHFGHTTTQGGYAALYLEAFLSSFYLDAAVWAGDAWVKNERHLFFPSFEARAKSSYQTPQTEAHVGLGYDFLFDAFPRILLEPFVTLDAVFNWNRAYKETGASPFNMQSSSRFSSMLRTELGLNNTYTWRLVQGTSSLRLKLSYVNKAPFQTGNLTAHIVGSPGSFTVEAFTHNQNLFSPSLGYMWETRNQFSFSLLYDGEFGSGYTANQVVFKLSQRF